MLEGLTQTTALAQKAQEAAVRSNPLKLVGTSRELDTSRQAAVTEVNSQKNMKGYKRISLQVSPTLHRKFKVMANEREETMNSLINTALKEFIRQEEEQIENVKRMKERLNKK